MTASVHDAPRASISTADINVVPTGRGVGAEVRGLNLANIDDTAFARIVRAWHDHSVLLFRDQPLDDHNLIAFSRRLGDLDWAPVQETGRRFVEGLPEIYVVSNVEPSHLGADAATSRNDIDIGGRDTGARGVMNAGSHRIFL